ncbi:hypothetical protein AAFF_G00065120 [Aldrovandia affinis]|uniref:Uncharacterized protein n=1 Tax=Aldrovandia affinis TaxID=143900 RepID=A0AAD7T3S7_9TELE|nr:hypothetical protein AAFF_G00065120 [Aldrovandia affinis]
MSSERTIPLVTPSANRHECVRHRPARTGHLHLRSGGDRKSVTHLQDSQSVQPSTGAINSRTDRSRHGPYLASLRASHL